MNVSCDMYCWIELAGILPDGGMVRNHWVGCDDVGAMAEWRKQFSNTNIFSSVCWFLGWDRQTDYVCDFYLDVDTEDLELAQLDTLRILDLLFEHLGIAPDCVDLSFSGATGFHLIVPLVVFGNRRCFKWLVIWRALAGRLAKEGFKHLNLGIYRTSSLLRLPNSINSKSGLYKIPLEYKELRDLGVNYVLAEARSPRQEDNLSLPEECPKAIGWLTEALRWYQCKQAIQEQHYYSRSRPRRRIVYQKDKRSCHEPWLV